MTTIKMKRKQIRIKGIVQGVGFRPFIYSLANRYGLNGFVLNDTEGVMVEVEGSKVFIDEFLLDIKNQVPPLSIIEQILVRELPVTGYKKFAIKPSASKKEKFVLISPDIATCDDCLDELFDPENRKYGYPFLNCTNCGPRFTIIENIPYDRGKTTMAKFPMCRECQNEYDNPFNRRFHAQPNCCSECGPHLALLDKSGKEIATKSSIIRTCEFLRMGKIVAIKGLGGFHLACDARNQEVVAKLRRGKRREEKPFALMAKDIQSIKTFCKVNELEQKLLISNRKPIVLLEKIEPNLIAAAVAPQQKYLGMMLPYTPIHHLLFSSLSALVMTSGNFSNEPIVYSNCKALEQLGDVADYFLVHNRKIHTRCDDSVTRIFNGSEMLVRRSRGYVPEPVEFPYKKQILSCGAQLSSTFCLTRDNYAFMSHYIGDLENLETLEAFEEGIEHFKKLFSIEPQIIAYDLHPEYLSTKYAKQLLKNNHNLIGVPIQHHHAHIVSCMVDNCIDEKVIGIAFDGLGYGTDGNLWGGEFFTADFNNFQRMAHFQNIPMPGGTKAIDEPWRMAISYLYQTYGKDFDKIKIACLTKLNKKSLELVTKIICLNINSPLTSSVGRLFDAVSSLLGICDRINYQGQAAIELEMAIESPGTTEDTGHSYGYTVKEINGIFIIEPACIISGIVEDIIHRLPASIISLRFHTAIAGIIVDICDRIRKTTGLNSVVLTGGVFQNMFLLRKAIKGLDKKGFNTFTQHRVPTNDGGIALGQAVIAGYRVSSITHKSLES